MQKIQFNLTILFIHCLTHLHCKAAELHPLPCHVHLSKYNNL